MEKEAYPLHWPLGYSRTESPEAARFTTTMGKATKYLVAELGRDYFMKGFQGFRYMDYIF